jgi:hypothetical protein
LFNAALAEFELHFWSLQYLENANPNGDEAILLAARSEKPINGPRHQGFGNPAAHVELPPLE